MSETGKTQTVGIIGLGSMGMGSALAMVDAGLTVIGCDVSAAACDQFIAGGGQCAENPGKVAEQADIVLVVVVNSQQVDSVLFGDNGVVANMQAGGLVIQCATVAPSYVRELEGRLAERGLNLIDAPISGGSVKARQGKLSVMASGAPTNFDRAKDVLNAIAEKIYRLGDAAGAGSSVKLVNQHLAGIHIAAAAEAMALGISMGLDPDTLYEVITNSAGNSWMFENRVPHILAGDYTPHSAVNIFVKDLGIVHSTGRELTLPLPIASTALQQFTAASAAGHGREDDSAVIKVYEHLTGLQLPKINKD